MITPRLGLSTKLGKIAATISTATDKDLLACWLVEARNAIPGSDAHLLIGSMPTETDMLHLPAYWTVAELDELRGSETGRKHAGREHDLDVFLADLQNAVASARLVDSSITLPTHEDWRWATSIVSSRAYDVPDVESATVDPGGYIDDEDDLKSCFSIPVLVPLVDMLNHRFRLDGPESSTCEWGVERDSGAFLVRSRRGLAVDCEMTISYGSIGQCGALLNYGFVPEEPEEWTGGFSSNNAFQSATVRLRLNDIICPHVDNNIDLSHASSEATAAGTALLRHVWGRDDGRYTFGDPPGQRTVALGLGACGAGKTLLSLLRVAVAAPEELKDMLEAVGEPPESGLDGKNKEDDEEKEAIAAMLAREPFGLRNEAAAMAALVALVDRHLACFPSLEPAGRANGGSSPISNNQANARKVSAGEQLVLRHWRELAVLAGKHLQHVGATFDGGLRYPKLLSSLIELDELLVVR